MVAPSTKISVIIVTYNAEHTISNAINSVLTQTYNEIELLIIDGGSTDKTNKIISGFSNKINYFISEKDNGIYDAMNKGIQASTGEWLIFIGADDIFSKNNSLEEIFCKNKFKNIDFIYGDVKLKSNNKILGGHRDYNQLIEKNICHQAIFYNKSIFEKVGNYNLKYKILADYDLNLRVFRNSQINTKYISTIVSIFNDKGGASSTIIDNNFFSTQLDYFINIEKIEPKSPLLQQYYFYVGLVNIINKDFKKGFLNVLKSFMSGKRKLYFILIFIKIFISNSIQKTKIV